jgi:hypothetical protein
VCARGDQVPGDIAEALGVVGAALDRLNSEAAADPDGATCGEVLRALSELRSKFTAAHLEYLRRFDAAGAHDADGYATSSSWLAAMTKTSRHDAKAVVGQMRRLSARPHLAGALTSGVISESWASEIIKWTKQLPAELRAATDKNWSTPPPPARAWTTWPRSPPTPSNSGGPGIPTRTRTGSTTGTSRSAPRSAARA